MNLLLFHSGKDSEAVGKMLEIKESQGLVKPG